MLTLFIMQLTLRTEGSFFEPPSNAENQELQKKEEGIVKVRRRYGGNHRVVGEESVHSER